MPFQLAAARRRLVFTSDNQFELYGVSTRSRPKAAGTALRCRITPAAFQLAAARRRLARGLCVFPNAICFNSQPPEGGWLRVVLVFEPPSIVSTRSRPKAAGFSPKLKIIIRGSFNSQPPEGGWLTNGAGADKLIMFQLAAARRRLAGAIIFLGENLKGFNSQPPEGGWPCRHFFGAQLVMFQLAAARRRLAHRHPKTNSLGGFQLAAARRRLAQHVYVVDYDERFQLAAARRRLVTHLADNVRMLRFQLAAARRRLVNHFGR